MMCEAPAKAKPFRVVMHTAVLADLEHDTTYSYWMDGDDSGRTFSFRSPLRVGSDAPFSFIAYGDMGESVVRKRKAPMAAATVDAIRSELDARPADLILHVGDISYADGRYKAWDAFMEQVEPLSSSMPYMVGVGNHESGPCKRGAHRDPSGEEPFDPDWGNYGPESGGECGAMVAARFPMPGSDLVGRLAAERASAADGGTVREVSSGGGARRALRAAANANTHILAADATSGSQDRGATSAGESASAAAVNATLPADDPLSRGYDSAPLAPFWYSFEYGSVHFALLSTEHDFGEGSRQRRWLEADLEAVDRCRTPWLVVALHRPMYVVYPHKDNRIVGEHIRAAIEPLLLSYDVDLTIAGHVHAYYRSCAAADNRCVRDDEDGIRHFVIGTAGHELSSVENDQKDWCEEVINDHGFGRFDVDGDEMTVSFIHSRNGKVGDRVTLRAKVPPGSACDARQEARTGSGIGEAVGVAVA